MKEVQVVFVEDSADKNLSEALNTACEERFDELFDSFQGLYRDAHSKLRKVASSDELEPETAILMGKAHGKILAMAGILNTMSEILNDLLNEDTLTLDHGQTEDIAFSMLKNILDLEDEMHDKFYDLCPNVFDCLDDECDEEDEENTRGEDNGCICLNAEEDKDGGSGEVKADSEAKAPHNKAGGKPHDGIFSESKAAEHGDNKQAAGKKNQPPSSQNVKKHTDARSTDSKHLKDLAQKLLDELLEESDQTDGEDKEEIGEEDEAMSLDDVAHIIVQFLLEFRKG